MEIEQFVMAYSVEQDRLRALLPDGFSSLRPVLCINAELRDGKTGYVEFNTAAEKNGVRGWLNIAFWDGVPFEQDGNTTRFVTDFLDISFTGVGIEGGCPAEKDNAGCFFPLSCGKAAPVRAGRGEKGILRLLVPVVLRPRRRTRRKPRQNAARVPVPAADRLSQSAVYRAERSPNPLPAGAGKLCRAV